MSKASNFPAGQENIDNLSEEDAEKDAQFQQDYIDGEITDLDVLSLDQLGELYEKLDGQLEEIDAAKTEIKKTIFEKMEGDSQKVGPYNAYKAKSAKFPELKIEHARELGLTKIEEKLDAALCKKAHQNGVDLGKIEWEEKWVMRKIVEKEIRE